MGGVSGVGSRVACEDAVDFAGIQGDIPTPASESAMRVDGLGPFGEVLALGPILVAVPALRFQHQHVARLEPDEEVGTVLPHHAPMDVEHLEAQVVIMDVNAFWYSSKNTVKYEE